MATRTVDRIRLRAGTPVLVALIIGLLVGCSPVAVPAYDSTASPADPGSDSAGPAASSSQPGVSRSDPSRSPLPAHRDVRLSFGGDVMFEGRLRALLDDPVAGLAPLRAATSSADFTMVNLEAAITTRGSPDAKELEAGDNRYHFRTGPEALTALRSAGVDAVSVANNHGVDFGAEGLADTLRAKDRAELPVIGVGRNRAEAYAPHRVTLQGQSFAFFAADDSFLESTAPSWQAGPTTAGLAAARGDGRSFLLTAVRRAADAGDVPVVYLHWGEENSTRVTDRQRALALALARAGAAAVVGTHTHRLQGAGWLGSTYVAYGLGNFVWYHGLAGQETGLLDLTVRNGRVVADAWRPAVIPESGGLPSFRSGESAAGAIADWRSRRRGTGLGSRPPTEPPVFSSSVGSITPAIRRRMASTYREGCPVPLEDLRYLQLSYWNFDGEVRRGELVIAAEHASSVVAVFRELYRVRFPLARLELVSAYGGDDERSMAANNSSGFNCRPVAGTNRWSQHSFGAAIDLNPVQNPYVTETGVSPATGRPYADPRARRAAVQGLITPDSAPVRAFRKVGWEWGGDWVGPKDFQHFSAAGS